MSRHSPHRLVLVLFALVTSILFYSGFSSIVGMSADHAAQFGALAAFGLTALVSLIFKNALEE